jgi:hypothetical protein
MSKVSDYILPIGLLAAIAIIIYLAYNYLKDNPISKAIGGVIDTGGTVADVITKPGINFIPGLEDVDVPHLITTPGYQLIGDALNDVKLPEITLPDIDLRPGYQIIGDIINPPKKDSIPVTKPVISHPQAKSSERDVIKIVQPPVGMSEKTYAKIKSGKIF